MNQRGFTLIETLVALVILAVGLLAVAAMGLTYVRSNTHSQQLSVATVAAQEKMEQLRGFATSERIDNFSVFDFDYLVGTQPNFITLADGTQVDGYCSGGNGGVASINSLGTAYGVLAPAACPGTAPGAGTCYSASDIVETATGAIVAGPVTGFSVNRTWWVQPWLPAGAPAGSLPDYAWIAVDSSWTDRNNVTRTIHLESLVYRRQ